MTPRYWLIQSYSNYQSDSFQKDQYNLWQFELPKKFASSELGQDSLAAVSRQLTTLIMRPLPLLPHKISTSREPIRTTTFKIAFTDTEAQTNTEFDFFLTEFFSSVCKHFKINIFFLDKLTLQLPKSRNAMRFHSDV